MLLENNSKLNLPLRNAKQTARAALLIAGAMLSASCSTTAVKVPTSIQPSAYCPPADAILSDLVFKSRVDVLPNETAFETVTRMKLSEDEKNSAGMRLIYAYKRCRQGMYAKSQARTTSSKNDFKAL